MIEEIIKLSLREDLINNETIQTQIVKILMKTNELLKALEICERESFLYSESMQMLKRKILMRQELKIKKKVLSQMRKFCL